MSAELPPAGPAPLPPPPPPLAPPAYPAPAPRSRSRTGLVIGLVAGVAVLVVVAIAVGVVFIGVRALRHATVVAGPVTPSTVVNPNRGKVVFSDDFHDSSSGWTTDSLPSGTSFKYTPDGYVVVGKGTLDHFAGAPYSTPVAQVAISVKATQSADAPVAAGYGVSCWRGIDSAELRYDFIVSTAGDWTVDRRDGGVLTRPLVLKQGTSSVMLGATPVTVEGMCATMPDQHGVRLLLFAGTQKIADFTDSATTLPDTGWQADMMLTSSAIHDSTVTVTHFEVRDLAR